ncbi:MAG: glycosyltransferase family 4 protein [Candidatus Obscuribacterales bacterium]|nr:glycosyltransferase family 4 protein [Candidatus Obscuribacterales bacterium]
MSAAKNRILQSKLFDAQFYASQIATDVEPDLDSLILHYLSNSSSLSLDPHPLFDTQFYVSQNSEVDWTMNNPLLHFLNQSGASNSSPHPLFSNQFYREKYKDVPRSGSATFLHYIQSGYKEGRQPCEDFDPLLYAQFAGLKSKSEASLYEFIKIGAGQGYMPQFFFDEVFAIGKATSPINTSYRHPKFTRRRSAESTPEVLSQKRRNACILFESGLIDTIFVSEQLGKKLSIEKCISAYLNQPLPRKLQPHPLFDVEYYELQNNDVDFSAIDPLVHFLTQGWLEGRNPHILFDTNYYLAKNEDVKKANINPLCHFSQNGKPHRLFSPFFHPQTYGKKFRLQRLKTMFSSAKSPIRFVRFQGRSDGIKSFVLETRLLPSKNLLSHFILTGFANGVLPLENFDLLFDVTSKTVGLDETQISIASVTKSPESLVFKFNPDPEVLAKFLQSLTRKKGERAFARSSQTIILTAHEASRTGAPLLLLRMAQEFSQRGWECLIVLDRGGPIESDFSKFGHVLNFKANSSRYNDWQNILSLLYDNIGLQLPNWCILNSLETGLYAEAAKKHGMKVVNLVHEIADSYPPNFVPKIFKQLDLVVFPAEFVQKFAHKRTGDLQFKETVIHSALLDENFADFDKSNARLKWREELGISSESLVVLACGSPNQRKGVDIFFSIAQSVLATTEHDIHFVWLGSGNKIAPHTPQYYVDWDIRQSEYASRIHWAKERADLRTAFHGSDLFILTSRQDPFPCVGHNAMQASLPILCFAGAGGTPEMIAGAGGKAIPYGDVRLFSEAIIEYIKDEALRDKHGALNKKVVVEKFSFIDYADKILLALSET